MKIRRSSVKSRQAHTTCVRPFENVPRRVSWTGMPRNPKTELAMCSEKQLFEQERSFGRSAADGGNFRIQHAPCHATATFLPLMLP